MFNKSLALKFYLEDIASSLFLIFRVGLFKINWPDYMKDYLTAV